MGDETLKLDPDEVAMVAKKSRRIGARVAERKAFKRVKLTEEMFGGFPAAREFVAVHRVAHEVLGRTLLGVQKDLDDFATGLEKAVEGHLAIEDHIEAILRKLDLGFGTGVWDPRTSVDDGAMADIGESEAPSEAEKAREGAINGQEQEGDES